MKKHLCIYLIVLTAIPFLLLNSCAPNLKQYYPGKYYFEDSIYENKTLQFLITYSGGWYLFADPSEMDQPTRRFAESLHKTHQDLLFTGATTDGLYGTRCIAGNYNLPIKKFAENIQRANNQSIQKDQGLTDFYAGPTPAVKWVYDQMGFRFSEYFFKIDTYDIRISFWTKPELFDNYLDIFEQIMGTLTTTGPSL
jgi:hypothetical protein